MGWTRREREREEELAFTKFKRPLVPAHFELGLSIGSSLALRQPTYDGLLNARDHLHTIVPAVAVEQESPLRVKQADDHHAAFLYQHAFIARVDGIRTNL